MNGRRLYRSRREHMLGGVAGGIAEYFDVDPALVRIAWAVLILVTAGAFFVLYVVMWIVVPEAPPSFSTGSPSSPASSPGTDAAAAGPAPSLGTPTGEASSIADDWAARRAERRRHRSGEGGILLGAVLILIGAWFLARDYVPWLRVAQVWPLALVLVGILLLIGAMRRRAD